MSSISTSIGMFTFFRCGKAFMKHTRLSTDSSMVPNSVRPMCGPLIRAVVLDTWDRLNE